MKLPPKVTYSLLASLVLVSIVFRYPLDFGHETGSDTTFIHSLSDSIMQSGFAVWILHPTSYFGLYALSYPSGMPFMLASISSIGGISLEGGMLISGVMFGIVGVLGSFTAARAAKDDDRFALIVALLFSISPFFLKQTTWIGSSRGVVTALVPSLFLVLLIYMRRSNPRHIALALILIVTMMAYHRMGELTLFVLIAFVFAIPFHRVTQRLRFALAKYENTFRFASTGAGFAAFLGLFYVQFLFPGVAGPNVVDQYGTGAFLSGSSFPVLLLNMAIGLGGKVGLLFPLAVVGVLRYVWKRPKEDRDKFLLVAAFIVVPLLSLRDYIAEFLVFTFVILIVLALLPRRDSLTKRRVAAAALVFVLLLGAVGFSWYMKDYWRERYYSDSAIPDDLYSTGVYLRWRADANIISNEGMSAGRAAAISGRPVLPIGGASIHWTGPQQLTFGFVDPNSVAVRALPLTSISFQTDEIFLPVGVPNAKDDYELVFYNDYGTRTTELTLLHYDVRYLLLTNSRPTEFQSYIWRDAPFLRGALENTYQLYDSGANSVWFLG